MSVNKFGHSNSVASNEQSSYQINHFLNSLNQLKNKLEKTEVTVRELQQQSNKKIHQLEEKIEEYRKLIDTKIDHLSFHGFETFK